MQYAKNDSINDMSRHFEFYMTIFDVLENMLRYSGLVHLFVEKHNGKCLLDLLNVAYKGARFTKNMSGKIEAAPDLQQTSTSTRSTGSKHYYGGYGSRQSIGHVSKAASQNLGYQIALRICDCYEKIKKHLMSKK
eukprot:UN22543